MIFDRIQIAYSLKLAFVHTSVFPLSFIQYEEQRFEVALLLARLGLNFFHNLFFVSVVV